MSDKCPKCGTEHPMGRSIPRLGRLGDWGWREIAVAAADHAHCAEQRIAALEAIVAKLPKTKDGVAVVPCVDRLWYPYPGRQAVPSQGWSWSPFWARDKWSLVFMPYLGGGSHFCPEECYSTKEAADAAERPCRSSSGGSGNWRHNEQITDD